VLADLSYQTLGMLWLGALAGGIATGAAGFAFAVVAAAIWLHVLDPLHTAILVVSTGSLVQIRAIWGIRRAIDIRRLWPFMVGGFIGLPVGVYFLRNTDISLFRAGIGGFMILYGAYAVLAPRFPNVHAGRCADGVIGVVGGFMGGLGGYSGIAPTIWTQVRGWSKDAARSVFQPFILTMNLSLLTLVSPVALDTRGIILFAVTLPMVFGGFYIGWAVYGLLDERRFRQVLGAMLALSGAVLIL
jgi:uncharacterized protein